MIMMVVSMLPGFDFLSSLESAPLMIGIIFEIMVIIVNLLAYFFMNSNLLDF